MQKFIILLLSVYSLIYSVEVADINGTKIDRQSIIYLSYVKKPQRAYVNQIFKIKIKAIVATTKFDKIVTNFSGNNSYTILNPNNSWKWYNDNIYFNTYYIKSKTENVLFPRIIVSLLEGSNAIAKSSLQPINPEIIKLKNTSIFSGVIADNIKIIKTRTTKFNKNSNIFIMEIQGKNANLRDFRLRNVIKDGIDSYDINLPNIKIFYFAIISNKRKILNFSYFNTNTNSFEKYSIPIEIDNEDTSTQLGLNPKESKLETYKNIVLIAIAFFSLIVFIFRRKIVYIIIFSVIVVYLLLFYNPFDSIILKKNTKIRILPTYNSTIFYITDRKIVAEKLDSIKMYIKVLLPNGKIGWIKKENN